MELMMTFEHKGMTLTLFGRSESILAAARIIAKDASSEVVRIINTHGGKEDVSRLTEIFSSER